MKYFLIGAILATFSLANAQAPRPAKGSRVFISADNPKEDRARPHLIDRIEKWGYWNNVNDKDSADFIMEEVIKPKGGGVKGFVILKKKDGTEIIRSKIIKASGDPANGFSAWRGWSIGIGRWLKTTI